MRRPIDTGRKNPGFYIYPGYHVISALFLLLMIMPASGQEGNTPEILLRLQEGIQITDWYVVGPFHSGPREPLANPLAGTFDYETGIVDLDARYPSIYEFGGRVSWQEQSVDEDGNLVFAFDNPDWDKLNDEWGVSGIYYVGGAYSSFECDQKCEALINAHGIGSFYINGRRYSGDPYGHRLIQTPVVLDEGTNHVFFMTGGFAGSDTVKFEILPAPETELIILDRDILVADIVRGEDYIELAGVPVLNTTNRWITDIKIEGGNQSDFNDLFDGIGSIAPLCVKNVPVRIALNWESSSTEEDTFEIPFTLTWGDNSLEFTHPARVRNPEDSRIVTFTSGNDHSTQKYAIRYPTNYDPEREYSLILTTHGAGVQAEGQVDAFEAKDWAFVVAPTNRRRFGFDWQDWGRLDAIEILDRVMEEYPIDPDRVYLIGHSMGGHGAWHIGTTHADRFAAIVPSAGWASFQLYVPWFLRADELYADPNLTRIFEQCTNPDRTERLLPNLRNVPVLAVHGGDDDNVPPTHARLLIGTLERMGYDARLWEESGQGHWWDAHPGIPGADCVDGLRIRTFCRERVRDPFPRHVTFVSYDLANNNSMYWVRVEEEISPIGRIYVDAEFTNDGKLVVTTDNVLRLTIDFQDDSTFEIPGQIIIDGMLVNVENSENSKVLSLVNNQEGWCMGFDFPDIRPPFISGPIKRAYFTPFTIVVGQSGTPEQNELNMEIARNLSQRWWYRANGSVTIMDYGLPGWAISHKTNLIAIGGPDSNLLSAEYANRLPFQMEDDGIWMGDEFIAGEDLACQFVYPRPVTYGGLAHFIWGNSLEGMRLSGSLTCLYSGSNLPDFLIYDDDVRLMGYAGVRAAGFFNNLWELDPDYYYIRR